LIYLGLDYLTLFLLTCQNVIASDGGVLLYLIAEFMEHFGEDVTVFDLDFNACEMGHRAAPIEDDFMVIQINSGAYSSHCNEFHHDAVFQQS